MVATIKFFGIKPVRTSWHSLGKTAWPDAGSEVAAGNYQEYQRCVAAGCVQRFQVAPCRDRFLRLWRQHDVDPFQAWLSRMTE
jgi:hypothetical protein